MLVVSAVALVVESEAAAVTSPAGEAVSLTAAGDADDVEADGVIAADPDDDDLLDVPEVVDHDGMPDSDLEE